MRLIDADALLKSMHDYWGENPADTRMVNAAPTVDAIQVVRCGECKFLRTTALTAYCPIMNNYPAKDFYCGAGERKNREK